MRRHYALAQKGCPGFDLLPGSIVALHPLATMASITPPVLFPGYEPTSYKIEVLQTLCFTAQCIKWTTENE